MAQKKEKVVTNVIKLLIKAGQAKPAPPVGPALGQAGLNIMSFCKDFNAKTTNLKVCLDTAAVCKCHSTAVPCGQLLLLCYLLSASTRCSCRRTCQCRWSSRHTATRRSRL